MVDIRITYETLFDLLRREKNREELQKLDKDFYEQVLAYLKEKKEALSKKGDELFVSAEREKLKIQFQNIRRIIKELYERREKKVINMAMSKARTGSDIIDTTNLLPSEKEFFKEQVGLLTKYKDSVLDAILHLKEFNNIKKEEGVEEEVKKEVKAEVKEEPKEKEELKQESEIKEKEALSLAQPEASREGKKKIRITTAVPQFVGAQGQALGPFNEGDEVELDTIIADILVKKGSAESL
ncbi:hypothetical protein AYK26_00500 [Euryarchaeota archaeon SM23-78]|nr:MAG: hypothetical protein AYK26_00500 [Euryarchaeota archaeon SM23-78]MBW3001238.1 hypothetical protein [Candidatus Woesearchaeota archaeon]